MSDYKGMSPNDYDRWDEAFTETDSDKEWDEHWMLMDDLLSAQDEADDEAALWLQENDPDAQG